jgi:hypothetical protein
MRMQVQTEGGFAAIPGFTKPIVLESCRLPPQEAEEMRQLVTAARFFELPAQQPSPQRGADYRRYTIIINDRERHHSIQFTEPIPDSHLRDLLAFALRHRSGS